MRIPCNASAAPSLLCFAPKNVYTPLAGKSPPQAEHALGVLKGARLAFTWMITVAAHAQQCAGFSRSKHDVVLQVLLERVVSWLPRLASRLLTLLTYRTCLLRRKSLTLIEAWRAGTSRSIVTVTVSCWPKARGLLRATASLCSAAQGQVRSF